MKRFHFDCSFLTRSLVLAVLMTAVLPGCTDPGRCAVGSEGCVCGEGFDCDTGLACFENRCVDEDSPSIACSDACAYAGDGECDDGGEGARYSVCSYASDCSDCGARRNECTGSTPQYCPQAGQAGDPTAGCWSTATDCNSLSQDPDDLGWYACNLGSRSDNVANTCVANPCTDPAYPVFCDVPGLSCGTSTTADCCWPEYADCRTVTLCHGEYFYCSGWLDRDLPARTIDCGATIDDVVCN